MPPIITINKEIIVSGATSLMKKDIKAAFTVENKEYYKMMSMGKWVGKIQKHFFYYKTIGDNLVLPKGAGKKVYDILKKHTPEVEVKEETVCPSLSKNLIFTGELRDYQKPVIEQIMKKRIGVIHASTGFGKTISSIYLASIYKTPTLFITTRTHLVQEFINSILSFTNFEKEDIGIIQGKKFEIKDLTVASIATLRKLDVSSISKSFGMVFFDEIHMQCTEKQEHIMKSFYAKYHYGMTATPKKDTGVTESIFFHGGEIIASYAAPILKPKVHIIRTNFEYEFNDDYSDLIGSLISDEERNELVIQSMAEYSGIKLILSKRKEHCYNLAKKIGEKAVVLTGDLSSKELDAIKKKLKNEDHSWEYVIGTFSLLGTGFDVPSLEVLGIAGDVKGDVLTSQSIGRILRLWKNKSPVIVDFVEQFDKCPVLYFQHKKRYNIYKANKFFIEYV